MHTQSNIRNMNIFVPKCERIRSDRIRIGFAHLYLVAFAIIVTYFGCINSIMQCNDTMPICARLVMIRECLNEYTQHNVYLQSYSLSSALNISQYKFPHDVWSVRVKASHIKHPRIIGVCDSKII